MGLEPTLLRPNQGTIDDLKAAADSLRLELGDTTRRAARHRRAEERSLFGGTAGYLLPVGAEACAGCVHEGGGRAVWGPVRATEAEAQQDRLALQMAIEQDRQVEVAVESSQLLKPVATGPALRAALAALKGDTGQISAVGGAQAMMDDLFGGDGSDGD